MARLFDGSTDRIDWSAPVTLGTEEAFTISLWGYLTSRDDTGDQGFFSIEISGDSDDAIQFIDVNDSGGGNGLGVTVRRTSFTCGRLAVHNSLTTGT